jgi:hypothetical protein
MEELTPKQERALVKMNKELAKKYKEEFKEPVIFEECPRCRGFHLENFKGDCWDDHNRFGYGANIEEMVSADRRRRYRNIYVKTLD